LYAKPAVIKLPEFSQASGKKSISDNAATIRFLCGKLKFVGLKFILNSDKTNHQFDTMQSII
jgi:hypothetical protein